MPLGTPSPVLVMFRIYVCQLYAHLGFPCCLHARVCDACLLSAPASSMPSNDIICTCRHVHRPVLSKAFYERLQCAKLFNLVRKIVAMMWTCQVLQLMQLKHLAKPIPVVQVQYIIFSNLKKLQLFRDSDQTSHF